MNASVPSPVPANPGLPVGRYLEALIRHELAIGQLYEAIAAQAALEKKTFWKTIAQEERAHAAVLDELRKLVEQGAAAYARSPFTMMQILESLDFIAVNRKAIEQMGITSDRALDLALQVEQSIIETNYFAIFSDDSAELRAEFDALHKHTQEHIERIRHHRVFKEA